MEYLKTYLKEFAFGEGMALFGVADFADFEKAVIEEYRHLTIGFKRGISVAIALSDSILDTIEDKPNRIYLHHYRTANAVLDSTTMKISSLLISRGYKAMPVAASLIMDWKNQRGLLSHKAVAVCAGLGWIGRNSLLINPQYGSRIRLATVLTDAEFPVDGKTEGNCGDCNDCITVCPAGAVHEDLGGFELKKCYEKLVEFSKTENLGHYICGVCLKVCRR